MNVNCEDDGFESNLIINAVTGAIAPFAHLERSWDLIKLERRLRHYCRRAAKDLQFNVHSWETLVNEYADNVFGSIFQALGDRKWLTEVDFLLVIDAGVKDTFPPSVISPLDQQLFERTVLAAHDRAFDENRFLPILWEMVHAIVSDEKTQKMLCSATAFGRRAALSRCGKASGIDQVKDFVSKWIDGTILKIGVWSQGSPEKLLTETKAIQFFHGLIEAGSLPIPLMSNNGQPPHGWPFIEYTIRIAYIAHDVREFAPVGEEAEAVYIGKKAGKRAKDNSQDGDFGFSMERKRSKGDL